MTRKNRSNHDPLVNADETPPRERMPTCLHGQVTENAQADAFILNRAARRNEGSGKVELIFLGDGPVDEMHSKVYGEIAFFAPGV